MSSVEGVTLSRKRLCQDFAVWLSIVGLAVITGCSPELKDVGDGAVSLRATDAAGLQKVLEKHRGKVVLVDFWATWCGPCIEQFPHTVELADKFGPRGLAVVSVSMDNPSAEPQVRAFLEKQDARFENLLSSYGSPVTATKEFGLPGPVPCYRIYDREGQMYREFRVDPRAAKQFTTADIDAAVEEVLRGGVETESFFGGADVRFGERGLVRERTGVRR